MKSDCTRGKQNIAFRMSMAVSEAENIRYGIWNNVQYIL